MLLSVVERRPQLPTATGRRRDGRSKPCSQQPKASGTAASPMTSDSPPPPRGADSSGPGANRETVPVNATIATHALDPMAGPARPTGTAVGDMVDARAVAAYLCRLGPAPSPSLNAFRGGIPTFRGPTGWGSVMHDPRLSSALRQLHDLGQEPAPSRWHWRIDGGVHRQHRGGGEVAVRLCDFSPAEPLG
jgi:hypothetical protein